MRLSEEFVTFRVLPSTLTLISAAAEPPAPSVFVCESDLEESVPRETLLCSPPVQGIINYITANCVIFISKTQLK